LARNDDGEFELILGNRQLVSVFLIVVILLGVFFSMGYIVGRNSSPPAVTANAGKPIVVDNSPHAAAPLPEEPASAPPAAVTPAPTLAPEAPPPVIEKPSPIEKKPDEPKKAVAKPVEPKPSSGEVGRRAEVGQPPAGTYLQVVATIRPDAEIIAESLIKKGFHAMVAPIPDSPTHRVIVGPLKDAAEVAETRSRLEAAGFKPIVRKY
jgi:cell division protein FtsN